ncbi:MAG: winged helix-turn-helix transcriptional regulator [Candidatus Woesearchaeota archaeon]|jgi:DNA-binding Lrp family transcriptional regulator
MNYLDLKDKKLITLLHRNSRAKLHELAAELKLSKNSVKYRIERLQEKGYILRFIPIIDYNKIHYSTYDLFIKLKMRKEQEHLLIEHLKNNPKVLWACTLFGEWDLFVQFVTKSFYDFYNTDLTLFLKKFGQFIDDYEIKIAVKRLRLQHGVPEYLPLVKEPPLLEKKINYSQPTELSLIDLKLLHALSQNARASFQELGQNIGESLETTRNHFNRLIKEGVLTGFTLNFEDTKIGYVGYLSFIRFHNFEKEEEFRQFILTKPEIKLALKNGNVPEIYLLISTRSPYELESLVKEIKDRFYITVHEITTMTITNEFKVEMFPEGLITEEKDK